MSSLPDTADAARIRGINRQPAHIYLFVADIATAILIRFDTPQSPLHLDEAMLPTPGLFQGHLLRLHGIHTGEPAKSCLIQLHCLATCFGGFLLCLQL